MVLSCPGDPAAVHITDPNLPFGDQCVLDGDHKTFLRSELHIQALEAEAREGAAERELLRGQLRDLRAEFTEAQQQWHAAWEELEGYNAPMESEHRRHQAEMRALRLETAEAQRAWQRERQELEGQVARLAAEPDRTLAELQSVQQEFAAAQQQWQAERQELEARVAALEAERAAGRQAPARLKPPAPAPQGTVLSHVHKSHSLPDLPTEEHGPSPGAVELERRLAELRGVQQEFAGAERRWKREREELEERIKALVDRELRHVKNLIAAQKQLADSQRTRRAAREKWLARRVERGQSPGRNESLFDMQVASVLPADVQMVSCLHRPDPPATASPEGGSGGPTFFTTFLRLMYSNPMLTLRGLMARLARALEGRPLVPHFSATRRVDLDDFFRVRPNPTGATKCLAIGIQHPTDSPAPPDALAEARNVKHWLFLEGFSMEPDRVRVLGGEAPATRSAMVEALRWLTGDAAAGDNLVLVVAAHGDPRTPPPLPAGGVGIAPTDAHAVGHVMDEELLQILVRGLPSGAHLTVLVDCGSAAPPLGLPYLYRPGPGSPDAEDTPPTMVSNQDFVAEVRGAGSRAARRVSACRGPQLASSRSLAVLPVPPDGPVPAKGKAAAAAPHGATRRPTSPSRWKHPHPPAPPILTITTATQS